MSLLQHVSRLGRIPWQDKVNRVHNFLVRLKTAGYYRCIFAAIGRGSLIYKPLLLSGTQFVRIGDYTLIRQGSRIEAIVLDTDRPPRIEIGNNVNIEQNVHLICSSMLIIGDNVSIAPNCGILDTSHPYLDVNDPQPIGYRINSIPTPVEIGANTLIGFGSIVLPGVHIGKNCVVGANSTVTQNIPDYCVAVGSPARIRRRYDFEMKSWVEPESRSTRAAFDSK